MSSPQRGVVALLTAQALAFGVMLGLLVVPANAIFLDAYGAKWLPATYIAIAVVGTAASAIVARAARHTRLVRVASLSLLTVAVLFVSSWLILLAGGVWVSAALLVLFPIALQMGFVFIGGQAGRLLDVRQMKERFPRIVGGFSVGFLLGGLLGIPLLSLLGSTESLLLGATVAQLVFLALLLETERRFPEVRTAANDMPIHAARPPARTLFASSLVLLLLVYQVLSAMGSWLLDYLLFNRANAHYSGDELTRFLSGYTAVLNLVAIVFLAVLAGPLMRRYGLRLGLVLNPFVVCAFLVVMAMVVAGPGAAAYSLFVLAAVVRLADIVLTDGTTRTSVNATFQMVPLEDRLAVQTVVEGIGVPAAIGATGVVLLAMNALGLGIGAVIVFTAVLSVIWTISGAVMYRAYTRGLADEMRHRSLADIADEVVEDEAALEALLRSDDARDVRLALDLLPGVASVGSTAGLRHAAVHDDPEVRMRALVRLAAGGDARAGAEAAAVARDLSLSEDPADRRAAAAAFAARDALTPSEGMLETLLDDRDPTVRSAALDAVVAEDGADRQIVARVVGALEEPRTAGSATATLRRLGNAPVPLIAAALSRNVERKRPALIRAAAYAAAEHGVTVIEPALRDGDRVVVLSALEALADVTDGAGAIPRDLLDDVFDDAASHAARAHAARASLQSDGSLARALDDEVDLARRLVIGVLVLRHGNRVRDAVRVVDCTEGQRRALGVEALDVLLSREEAAIALPLVGRDLASDDHAAGLRRLQPPTRDEDTWLTDLVDDPHRVWRSSWLALCARHASGR